MEEHDFSALAAVEGKHFWFRARRRAIETLVRQLKPTLPAPLRVLEIGCGNGFVTRSLVEIFGAESVTAVEPSEEGRRIARSHLACKVLEGDIASIDGMGTFSLVVMFDVLEHIQDETGSLAIARRLVAPGGVLLVTVPAHKSLMSYWDEQAGHYRRYERDGLVRVLERGGFRVEYATAIFRVLYPLMRITRWIEAPRGDRNTAEHRSQASMSELRIVPIANEMLAWWLERESARLTRRDVQKIGTSIVAIARAP